MSRRQPISSPVAAATMARSMGMGALPPPPHVFLPDAALPFWDEIIAGQPRHDWLRTPTLLATAASLAFVQYTIDGIRRTVGGGRSDGGADADAGARALVPQLLKLQAQEMSLLRVLQLHARAAAGPAAAVARRRALGADIEADIAAAFENDELGLLARPSGSGAFRP